MDSRKRQIVLGCVVIGCFFVFLGCLAVLAYMPTFVGEVGRFCLMMVTSPFMMEGTLAFLALIVVFGLNGWRRNKEGDDWVELDEDGNAVEKR